jgi:hypothetical protein
MSHCDLHILEIDVSYTILLSLFLFFSSIMVVGLIFEWFMYLRNASKAESLYEKSELMKEFYASTTKLVLWIAVLKFVFF